MDKSENGKGEEMKDGVQDKPDKDIETAAGPDEEQGSPEAQQAGKKPKRERAGKKVKAAPEEARQAGDEGAENASIQGDAAQPAEKPEGSADDADPAAEGDESNSLKKEGKKEKRKAGKKAKAAQEETGTAYESAETSSEAAAAVTTGEQGISEEAKTGKMKRPKKPGKMANIRLGKKEFKVPVKRIVWCSVALVLVALLVTTGVFVYRIVWNPSLAFDDKKQFSQMTPDPDETAGDEEEEESSEPEDTATPTPDPLEVLGNQADKSVYDKDIINVALIGVDHAPERDEKDKYYKDKRSFFSDVMIVLAINFKENKVDMITCPRDTYSPIYNQKGIWKMNSSFYWGYSKNKGDWSKGFENVCLSLQKVMGGKNVPPIDRYIGVDMSAVKTLVDAVGGVDYDVDLEIKSSAMDGRVLHKGFQHLNGQQALDYMRARKGTAEDTDKERVIRQKRMLIEIFKQIKANGKLMQLPGIIDGLKGQVFTNMDLEEMAAMAYFGMHLDDKNIKMRTIEGRVGARVADVFLYNWIFSVVDASKRNKVIQEVYGLSKKDILQYPHVYNFDYCKLDWAKDLGNGYLKIVNKILAADAKLAPEKQKITGANLLLIQQRITELTDAMKTKNFDRVEKALETLRSDMNKLYKSLGRKAIDWYVDENPKIKYIGG